MSIKTIISSIRLLPKQENKPKPVRFLVIEDVPKIDTQKLVNAAQKFELKKQGKL